MFCPFCGHENATAAQFCIECGKPLTPSGTTGQPAPRPSMGRGRGGLVLVFGVLSLAAFGPLAGIPAWIMGHKDLRKIRAGTLDPSQQSTTKAGMILGIIGTFVSPVAIIVFGIALAVGLSMFTAQSMGANRDAIIDDLETLAVHAHDYRIRPASRKGGDGSYEGYQIPEYLQKNDNGKYELLGATKTTVTFKGVSRQGYGSVTGTFGAEGELIGRYEFTGDFDGGWPPEREPQEVEYWSLE